MIVCFKRFEKITLDFSPVPVPVPISSLFLVCIEWYKTWWMHQLGLYRTLYSKGKDAIIKDFKLEILICLIKPSLNTELPYTKHHILSPPPLLNWGVTNVLWTSKAEEQCVRIHWPIYHESKHIHNGMSTEDIQFQQQETKGVQQREAADHQKC
jgi:hypothetical protein